MPKSNAKYPYQFKVMKGLNDLAHNLFAEPGDIDVFIIKLDDSGKIMSTLNSKENPDFNFWGDWEEEDFKSSLFLDVIDSGEYIYVKWKNVSKKHIEILLNIEFTDKDFVSSISDDITSYPESHSVMF